MEENLKFGIRLGLGFGIVPGLLFGVMVGVAASGYWAGRGVAESTPEALRGDARLTEHAARAQADMLALRRFEKNALLNSNSPAKAAESQEKWNELRALQAARLEDLEKNATRQEDKDFVRVMRKELEDSDAGFKRIVGMIQDGKITTPQAANNVLNARMQNRQF